jgi:hypothetical protein
MEYDTAFNFKLGAPAEMGGGAYVAGSRSPWLQEIQKLNARFDELTEEAEEEPEPKTLESAAIGLLNEPEKLRDVLESVRGIVDIGRAILGIPAGPQQVNAAAIGAVTRVGQPETVGEPGEVDPRFKALESALNRLERCDPRLIEHLTKLADVAEANPIRFKSLLTILETM